MKERPRHKATARRARPQILESNADNNSDLMNEFNRLEGHGEDPRRRVNILIELSRNGEDHSAEFVAYCCRHSSLGAAYLLDLVEEILPSASDWLFGALVEFFNRESEFEEWWERHTDCDQTQEGLVLTELRFRTLEKRFRAYQAAHPAVATDWAKKQEIRNQAAERRALAATEANKKREEEILGEVKRLARIRSEMRTKEETEMWRSNGKCIRCGGPLSILDKLRNRERHVHCAR
jgi:hypothetical protein